MNQNAFVSLVEFIPDLYYIHAAVMIIAVTAHTPKYQHMITVMVAMKVAMHGFVLM